MCTLLLARREIAVAVLINPSKNFFLSLSDLPILEYVHMHFAAVGRLQALAELHLGVARIILMDEAANKTDHNLGVRGVVTRR